MSVLFIILTGLTHFGVFAIAVLIMLISMIVFYRKKAILPILGILVIGVLLIFLFDSGRAGRLFSFWTVVFSRPAILQGPLPPLDLLNYSLSYFLFGTGVFQIYKQNSMLSGFMKNALLIFLVMLFFLSFPFIDIEYARRFNLFLFVPQIIVFFVLFRFFNQKLKIIISVLLVLVTMASIILMSVNMKPPTITFEAFRDLKKLEKHISEPDKTLIIARHGLEWWTAWQLRTKVGQDKSLTENTYLKYDKILLLVQKDGINQIYPGQKNPFSEPYFPTDRKPLYVSDYFNVIEFENEDLKKVKTVRE